MSPYSLFINRSSTLRPFVKAQSVETVSEDNDKAYIEILINGIVTRLRLILASRKSIKNLLSWRVNEARMLTLGSTMQEK